MKNLKNPQTVSAQTKPISVVRKDDDTPVIRWREFFMKGELGRATGYTKRDV